MSSKDLKVVVFGCKHTTAFILKTLAKEKAVDLLVTINAEMGKKEQVADYCDLRNLARQLNIPVYNAQSYSLQSPIDIEFFSQIQSITGFVIGWQRLIPEQVLHRFREGIFGMHGSSQNLPFGRGRSPLNWSIIEGRTKFHTNLFQLKAGVDDGEILGSRTFFITEKDTGGSLQLKNTLAMRELIQSHLPSILTGQYQLMPQAPGIPTYYPRRYETDSLIDWEMPVEFIERFIRAVTQPFNGAYSFIGQDKIILWEAQIFSKNEFQFPETKPGEILEIISENEFLIKAIDGSLLVTNFSSVHQPLQGEILHYGTNPPRKFPTNQEGYFDLPA